MPSCHRLRETVSSVMIYRSGAAPTRRLPGPRQRNSTGGDRRQLSYARSAGSGCFRVGFRHMGGDRIHQGRRKTVIRLKPEFLETRADAGHLVRLDAGLDHRGHERRKSRSRRAGLLEQFGMDEVQTVERMVLVLDAAVHMRAADLAGVPLDGLRGIDDVKLVAILQHGDVVAWNHRNHREDRAVGFPALGAAAGVVVGDIALDADLDRLVLAFADQGSAGKAARTLLYSIVNRWVDVNCHGPILLGV